jgi:hypothetical protein
MVKLQEELISSVAKKYKSRFTNRFKSIFLQCKKIKAPCQEKNDVLQKNFPSANTGELGKVVTPVKTGVQRLDNSLEKLDSGFRRNDEFY